MIEIITALSENHIAYIFIVVSLSVANGVTKTIWDNKGDIKLYNINFSVYDDNHVKHFGKTITIMLYSTSRKNY